MTEPTPLLIRAAELLEEEAECLAQSSTIDDEHKVWGDDPFDQSAQKDHDEMLDVATQLRALHENLPRVVS